MQRLHPGPVAEVDVYEAYRPPVPGPTPFLRVNMVASLDGRVVDAEGVSGSLGGDGDRSAFFAMRHHADAILVGAGTARAEDFGGMRVRESFAAQRRADGREAPAPIVVVTGSVALDPASRLFTDTTVPPVVLTRGAAPPDRLDAVRRAGATVVVAGEDRVDLTAGLATLRADHGFTHVLCEGGPELNGQLLGAALVDELCLTVAPTLVGGVDPHRIVDGLAERQALSLSQIVRSGDELLLRYGRRGLRRA